MSNIEAPSIVIGKEMTARQVYDATVKLIEAGLKMKATRLVFSVHHTQGYVMGKITASFARVGFKMRIKQNTLAPDWWTVTFYIDMEDLKT